MLFRDSWVHVVAFHVLKLPYASVPLRDPGFAERSTKPFFLGEYGADACPWVLGFHDGLRGNAALFWGRYDTTITAVNEDSDVSM